MKRLSGILLLISFVLPLVFIVSCSGEMDEDDYVKALYDKRTRDNALMYVQEHKSKKAVPVLLYLIEKRYGTLKAIYTLGVIGDPVAVPELINVIKDVAKKDSLDNDRMTEQTCMSLGMIGATNAVDTLIWTIDNAGEMGRAGAVQALGMIGSPKAAGKLMFVVKNEKEKLLIRHYAAIALGRIKAPEAADTLVYALFVDDATGLNLFRDGQLSLIQTGGKAAREALIKGYELKNEDAMALTKKIDLKPEWVQIKTVNAMGELRDAEMADFLMGEFDKGVADKLVYELFAKIMQSLERIPLKKEHLEKIAAVYLTKPPSTAYLNEREILSKIFISNNYTDKLDEVMKIAEKGDTRLKNTKGKMQSFGQWCIASANIVSILADNTMSDRFQAFVDSGKCKADIFGLKTKTKELMANFNERMKVSKKCGKDMACWQKQVVSEKWQWREKALYTLANTGDKKYMADVMKTLKYKNEHVRLAVLYAINKLATKEYLVPLIRFWQDQKINKEYQKITESIGYTLFIRMREWGLDNSKDRKDLFHKAEQL